MPKRQKGSKGDLNPGSLDCESGILHRNDRCDKITLHNLCMFLADDEE